MTSRYSARIVVAAGDRAPAVLAAVEADARFHPDSDAAAVRVSAGGAQDAPAPALAAAAETVDIGIDADELPHLRAGVNSTLRLVQAAYESIGAAAARPAAKPPARPPPADAGGSVHECIPHSYNNPRMAMSRMSLAHLASNCSTAVWVGLIQPTNSVATTMFG